MLFILLAIGRSIHLFGARGPKTKLFGDSVLIFFGWVAVLVMTMTIFFDNVRFWVMHCEECATGHRFANTCDKVSAFEYVNNHNAEKHGEDG